ncbi:16S rRNA (cytosine(967)-C(5))-methyltransferase RsmB [Atopococcus tabaci]|uniref:16S rRNA (cytosine(967)-C(5))-methyltransferase RsmB n=1 Tax=Atopococcus tabaci TaxID=269774 RepID=UPI002409C81E|nr:16S rRNA (cytosine(967)-C(5))-methyltransferase RsmB [Atopococcus tabaci]
MANKQSIQKSSRYLAMETLNRIEKSGSYSNLEIDQVIRKNQLSSEEAGLLTELVYGVTQRRLTLDYYLAPFLKKSKKVDAWVIQLLRLSVYQLGYLERVPNHAVLDEAVEIAKKRGHKGIGNMVNAVLRNFLREELRSFDNLTDPSERISIQYSLPQWLVQRFAKEIGMEEAEKLAASLLEKNRSSARVNQNLISVEEALDTMKEEGFNVEKSQLTSAGIVAKSGHFAGSLLFKQGKITIQDESSMLVAPALRVEPHHQVLDACAAPGGKTTHIATYLSVEQGGKVTALDLHPHKVKLIEENAKRQHLGEVVDTFVMDAREAGERFEEEQFDRILIDAPCSGLGLMRRKPDIKYNKQETDFERLQTIQLAILESVSTLLKKGGLLVYSTCTITKEENHEVVDRFLNKHPEYKKETVFVEKSDLVDAESGDVTIYPHQYGTDGFYICCLKKTTS